VVKIVFHGYLLFRAVPCTNFTRQPAGSSSLFYTTFITHSAAG
jgi:hypothetical protein